jgi:hypothetical protein
VILGLLDIGASWWSRNRLLCSSGLWSTVLLSTLLECSLRLNSAPCFPSAHAGLLVFNLCSHRAQSVINPCSICHTVLCRALVPSQCSAAQLACYNVLVFLSALVLSQCSRLCSCVSVGHCTWFPVQCNELSPVIH